MLTIKTFPLNPLSENTYIVSDETGEAVIIDCGALYDSEKQKVSDYIDNNQLHPVAHLLTHGHFDHLFGAGYLYERYGLEARCSAEDLPLFEDTDGQMRDILGHAMRCPTGPAGPSIDVNTVIPFGNHQFTVIACPGHTPGGICFYCAEEKAIFSGDSIFQMSIGRTDFPGGHHWTLITALKNLLKTLPEDVDIYPGHGPKTTVGFERKNNPFISF